MSVYRSEMSDNLDRALQSVWMDQTLKPQEIILVKDGPLTSDLDNVIVKWEKLLDKKAVLDFRNKALNINNPMSKGMNENEDIYFQSVEARNKDYEEIPKIVSQYMDKIN